MAKRGMSDDQNLAESSMPSRVPRSTTSDGTGHEARSACSNCGSASDDTSDHSSLGDWIVITPSIIRADATLYSSKRWPLFSARTRRTMKSVPERWCIHE